MTHVSGDRKLAQKVKMRTETADGWFESGLSAAPETDFEYSPLYGPRETDSGGALWERHCPWRRVYGNSLYFL